MTPERVDLTKYGIEVDSELAIIICKKTARAQRPRDQSDNSTICGTAIPNKKYLFFRHLRSHGCTLARTEATQLWKEVSSRCATMESSLTPQNRDLLDKYRNMGTFGWRSTCCKRYQNSKRSSLSGMRCDMH